MILNFFLQFFMILLTKQAFSNEIEYKIQEEIAMETMVGDLSKNVFQASNSKEKLKILNIEDRFVKCFKINNHGQLVVARRIDRDHICEKSTLQPTYMRNIHATPDEECKIFITVASQKLNIITRVNLIIEDINDNSPSWNLQKIEVKFTDGCKERTKVALTPAYDKDIGLNAQIEYSFKERDLPFRLDTEDGFYLQTLQSLDREQKESYTFTLIASDKGSPVLTGEIEVYVKIEDINDNSPIFSKPIYRFKPVSEDSAVGTVIGKLEASDTDSGVNGKFNFKFAETVPEIVKHYFQIQSDGTVIVAAPLDSDRGNNELKFKVIVEDEALRPYSRSSDATVFVFINDVNDEKPELKLIFMNIDPRTKKPFLVEHTKIGTLIGLLEVSDKDFNKKDTVSCTIDNSQFTLISEDRPVKYKITINMDFDREKMTTADLRILCRDSQNNMASSNHSINIKDINDNPPNFTKSFYVVKIKENQPIHTKLPNKLIATDLDSESTIQYFILPEYSANFSIDRESGVISTLFSFDREVCASYTIKVIAKDSVRDPINTGTCTVQVIISDENDNKPVFTQEFYTFHTSENNHPSAVIGIVKAIDSDEQDSQSSLSYRLEHSMKTRPFKINSRSGTITAITTLDREKETFYSFIVYVEDGNEFSKRNTVTTTVTVVIDDTNDNSPKFIVPNATKSSFDISIKDTAGHKIVNVYAEDADLSDNAKIYYNITAGNEDNIFSVDSTTGLLLLSNSLQSTQQKPQLHYTLSVTACDYGKPKQLCTTFKNLRIIVNNGEDSRVKGADFNTENESKDKNANVHHEAIIICLAIVFITLLISASALICLIKCKPGFWCRRSSRATSKDKRFETGVNSQMLPTIDANLKDKENEETMRNYCSENHQWMINSSDMTKGKMGKYGYAIDHTNRPDYQTLESLCLASSMRATPQPRFIDPCSRFQTQTPFSHSASFLSNPDMRIINQLGYNPNIHEPLISDGQTHVYQSVDESNTVHLYSKLNETKKSSKYNLNESNLDPAFPSSNHNINVNSKPNLTSNSSKEKDLSKYSTYAVNESSFV